MTKFVSLYLNNNKHNVRWILIFMNEYYKQKSCQTIPNSNTLTNNWDKQLQVSFQVLIWASNCSPDLSSILIFLKCEICTHSSEISSLVLFNFFFRSRRKYNPIKNSVFLMRHKWSSFEKIVLFCIKHGSSWSIVDYVVIRSWSNLQLHSLRHQRIVQIGIEYDKK